MIIFGPFASLVCLLLALLTMHLLSRRQVVDSPLGRFKTIDGLRGYLAFFVFQCHAVIWFYYAKTGRWEVPPSNFFTHCGQSSVALFFMITGFLFTTKLMEWRGRVGFDWFKLFFGRVMRIYPLYIVVGLLHFLVLGVLSNGAVFTLPLSAFWKVVVNWLTLGQVYHPHGGIDFGGTDYLWILAGVTWTLPYEIYFYMALPVIGLLMAVRSTGRYLLLGALGSYLLYRLYPPFTYQVYFAGGILASFLVRYECVRRHANSRLLTLGLFLMIISMIAIYPSPYGNAASLVFLSVLFVAVAAGNDFWGLLTARVSLALGEVSYGIYLLHGMVLYVVFRLGFGLDRAELFSTVAHWSIVAAVTPFVLIISFLSYRYIELPCIRGAGALGTSIRNVFSSWFNVSKRVVAKLRD